MSNALLTTEEKREHIGERIATRNRARGERVAFFSTLSRNKHVTTNRGGRENSTS